jgi:hypothetical protein
MTPPLCRCEADKVSRSNLGEGHEIAALRSQRKHGDYKGATKKGVHQISARSLMG